jgi:glycosyltransferase involved in cell wall biosynthesis
MPVEYSKDHQKTPSFRKDLSVTVAIPCYNAANYLGNLLDSLFQKTEFIEEILVINDGSTDTTRQIAQRHGVRLIEHNENRGLACTRNTALQNSKGDIIIYLDADTLPHPKSLERIVSEYSNPDTMAVGGQELFTPSSTKANLWRNLFWRQTHGPKRIDNVWMLMGLCCSYRKNALLLLGGFDETYKTNGEDVDIGIRLRKAGYQQVYVPQIGVSHKRSDSLKSLISLVYRHSYWQSRALRNNGINPSSQMQTSIRWLFISTASSALRHKDFILTLMSLIVSTSAIMGRSIEFFSRKNSTFYQK